MDPKQQELIDKHAIRLGDIDLILIQEDNDLDASRGGRNTVYLHCETYQGRPSYASCLCVIDQTLNSADGKTHVLRPECAARISDRTCPAVELRKAELKAGKALFFVDYEKARDARAAQRERDRENSPIKFRRGGKADGRKFTPTDMAEFNARMKHTSQVKVATTPKTVEKTDDYNTNILEQVANKMLEQEKNNDGN